MGDNFAFGVAGRCMNGGDGAGAAEAGAGAWRGERDGIFGGASYAWYDDKHANGAFALFDPGQQGELHAAITAPEGRIRFAGEHCSLFHAWIQGAIESAQREAREVAAAA
jgi:monoamine oxidase